MIDEGAALTEQEEAEWQLIVLMLSATDSQEASRRPVLCRLGALVFAWIDALSANCGEGNYLLLQPPWI